MSIYNTTEASKEELARANRDSKLVRKWHGEGGNTNLGAYIHKLNEGCGNGGFLVFCATYHRFQNITTIAITEIWSFENARDRALTHCCIQH